MPDDTTLTAAGIPSAGCKTNTDRVILFGATGFTGRLTAAALHRRGLPVVLAGRDRARLGAVADSLETEFDTIVVDAANRGR